MKDKLDIAKQKLKSFAQSDGALWYLAGAVGGSIVTYAVIYIKIQHDYDQLLTLPLGKEAFDALVNHETNFVWFTTGKHEHVFHVILDQ